MSCSRSATSRVGGEPITVFSVELFDGIIDKMNGIHHNLSKTFKTIIDTMDELWHTLTYAQLEAKEMVCVDLITRLEELMEEFKGMIERLEGQDIDVLAQLLWQLPIAEGGGFTTKEMAKEALMKHMTMWRKQYNDADTLLKKRDFREELRQWVGCMRTEIELSLEADEEAGDYYIYEE
ncbi:hypothetical protein P280DRAFT_474524 [Massarina eburnea CBS 473.64]|uniref:Uncharacterized protein n=1 Tax=Massarina eburnea CBS 473.64 TaxID=1395130 RepID=A0A6A6RJF0_9PLEO|nr:hypothetical protein P280DRAFT_474524 [Massarina eburnea CBS 473.64]